MVPDATREKGGIKNLEVSGIVVREHPVIVDGRPQCYDVAIYFDGLSDSDRRTISKHIEETLSVNNNGNK